MVQVCGQHEAWESSSCGLNGLTCTLVSTASKILQTAKEDILGETKGLHSAFPIASPEASCWRSVWERAGEHRSVALLQERKCSLCGPSQGRQEEGSIHQLTGMHLTKVAFCNFYSRSFLFKGKKCKYGFSLSFSSDNHISHPHFILVS